MTPPWDDADVISAYSQAQAIEDGTLVEVKFEDEPRFARGAGFLCPVVMTSTLFHLVEPNEAERAASQDLKGRMWDVLHMARMYRPRPIPDEGATWLYPCIFVVRRPDEYPRVNRRTFHLKAVLAGGDHGEPCVTLMLANED